MADDLRLNVVIAARNSLGAGFAQARGEIARLGRDVAGINSMFSAGAFVAGIRAVRRMAESANELADAWRAATSNAEKFQLTIAAIERVPVLGDAFAIGRNLDEAMYKAFGERLGMAKPKSLEWAETRDTIAKQQAEADAYSKRREAFYDFRERIGDQTRILGGATPELVNIDAQKRAMQRQAGAFGSPFKFIAESLANNLAVAMREDYFRKGAEAADKTIRDYQRSQAHQQFTDQMAFWEREDDKRKRDQLDAIRENARRQLDELAAQRRLGTVTGAPYSFQVGGRFTGAARRYEADQAAEQLKQLVNLNKQLQQTADKIRDAAERAAKALEDDFG